MHSYPHPDPTLFDPAIPALEHTERYDPAAVGLPALEDLVDQRATALYFECITVLRQRDGDGFRYAGSVDRMMAAGRVFGETQTTLQFKQVAGEISASTGGGNWRYRTDADPAAPFVAFMRRWEIARARPTVIRYEGGLLALTAFVCDEPFFLPLGAETVASLNNPETAEEAARHCALEASLVWASLARSIETAEHHRNLTLAAPGTIPFGAVLPDSRMGRLLGALRAVDASAPERVEGGERKLGGLQVVPYDEWRAIGERTIGYRTEG